MTALLSAAEQTTAAHRANARAAMPACGFDLKMAESDCMAELFKLCEVLAK